VHSIILLLVVRDFTCPYVCIFLKYLSKVLAVISSELCNKFCFMLCFLGLNVSSLKIIKVKALHRTSGSFGALCIGPTFEANERQPHL